MPAIRANPGPAYWGNPKSSGTFHPYGPFLYAGRLPSENPRSWSTRTTHAARLFVGLSVGARPRWSVQDVIQEVKAIRKVQGVKPDSSFILQRGLYQHKRGSGKTVEERSVQIIVIDTEQTPLKKFIGQMEGLAETLAERLRQEEVVLEIQRNGITVETIGMVPRKAYRSS